MKKPKIAIVGYGQFERFMAKHLRPYAIIVPIKRNTDPKKVSACDVVIFSVSWCGLEPVTARLKPFIGPETLLIDVMSVKQKPLAFLKKQFPEHQILGTHPIFGPQSGKNGIKGLPIVLCNESFTTANYQKVKKFLKKTLELKVIEESAKDHDTQMANIQGLTHFIGRALLSLDIKSYVTNTQSYNHLLELKSLLKNDSWELFTTIQNTNPEAKVVRGSFLKELQELEEKLQG